MRKTMMVLWIAAGMLIFSSMPLLAEGEWEEAASDAEKQIVVYTRSVENSPFKISRGVTTVSASLGAIVSLIADTDSFPEWMHNVKRSMVIEQISKTERITYTAQKLPWPVTDRDTVVYSRLTQDPDTKQVVINVEARPDAYPEQDGHVRIPEMTNRWELTPIGGGRVEVAYEIHVDPGGRIPTRLANSSIVDTPLNTLRGLHRMIDLPKYRDARIDTILEP
ncbi:MAG: START domain-containing protein [Desulfosalsimonadaceae bacterium]